jgi:hypothetical protein
MSEFIGYVWFFGALLIFVACVLCGYGEDD